MSEGAIAIVLSLLTMLTQVGAIALILFRTKGAKDAVAISGAQSNVDRGMLIDKIAGRQFDQQVELTDLKVGKAQDQGRIEVLLVKVETLNTKLTDATDLLAKQGDRFDDQTKQLNDATDLLKTQSVEIAAQSELIAKQNDQLAEQSKQIGEMAVTIKKLAEAPTRPVSRSEGEAASRGQVDQPNLPTEVASVSADSSDKQAVPVPPGGPL